MEHQWKRLLSHVSPEAATLLAEIARDDASIFADRFYKGLLEDENARTFVTHKDVDDRLHASFRKWITHLLTSLDASKVPALIAEQKHIGVIHARLNIQIDLVLRAGRHMKEIIIETILHHEHTRYRARYEAAVLAMGLVDVALEIMSAQYSLAHDAVTRTDEAYRNFATTMNMSLEREYQRTALSDWSNRMLQDVMIGGDGMLLPRLGNASVGLWLRHKAPAIFGEPRELEGIQSVIDTIDNTHLPALQAAITGGDNSAQRRLTRQVLDGVDQVRYLLDSLFDHLLRVESGSDALTNLLNRRFLPSILTREIALARSKGVTFSLMLLDIDHFKSINDRYGHEAGDRTLKQVAATLAWLTGSGDFLFRYGGEEFLIVCAEFDETRARIFAQKVRQEIEKLAVDLPEFGSISITASIGIATYDGHPDYQHLIHCADQALYEAKATGRNRCVSFTELPPQERRA